MFRTGLLTIIRSLNTVFTATDICHISYVDCLLAESQQNCTFMSVELNLQHIFVSYRAGMAQMSAAPFTPNWDSTGDKRCAVRLHHLFEIWNTPHQELQLRCRNFWVDTSDFPTDSSFANILGNKD